MKRKGWIIALIACFVGIITFCTIIAVEKFVINEIRQEESYKAIIDFINTSEEIRNICGKIEDLEMQYGKVNQNSKGDTKNGAAQYQFIINKKEVINFNLIINQNDEWEIINWQLLQEPLQ